MAGISATLRAAGSDPLDDDEYKGGVEAGAALAYQYGATLDARVMIALWAVGVSLPRITKALLELRAAKVATVEDIRAAGKAQDEREIAGKVLTIQQSPRPTS